MQYRVSVYDYSYTDRRYRIFFMHKNKLANE